MGKKVGAGAGDRPLLSVVLLTWNTLLWSRAAYHRVAEEVKTLPGAAEIIWVDQGSRDGTQEYLQALKGPSKKHYYRNGIGLPRATSVGRNLGLDSARGEFIMLLDGDIVPPLGWIAAALAWLREPKNQDFWGITLFPGLWTDKAEQLPPRLDDLREVRESASSMTNLGLYRRGYFEGNPFPTHGVWGDWGWGYEDTWQSAMGRRLGRKTACVFDPEARYLHPCNSSCGLLDRIVGKEIRKQRTIERKYLLDREFSERPVG